MEKGFTKNLNQGFVSPYFSGVPIDRSCMPYNNYWHKKLFFLVDFRSQSKGVFVCMEVKLEVVEVVLFH